jgi:hypothetical protein
LYFYKTLLKYGFILQNSSFIDVYRPKEVRWDVPPFLQPSGMSGLIDDVIQLKRNELAHTVFQFTITFDLFCCWWTCDIAGEGARRVRV